MGDQSGRKLGDTATFKDYLALVEGDLSNALDKAADWNRGPAFGGSAFGGSAFGSDKKDDVETENGVVPYYDDDMMLIPHAMAPGQAVTYSRQGLVGGMEERTGKLHKDIGNDQWEIIDDEDNAISDPVTLNMMRGYDPLQQESIDRLKELAGIQETASGGATGAGAIASVPSALGKDPLKRIKKKRDAVEAPSLGTSMLGHIQDPTPNTSELSGKMRLKRNSEKGKRDRARAKNK